MILDSKWKFAEADDVFSDGSVVLSENVVDLGVASPRDLGRGERKSVVIQVTTAFAGGTSAEFTVASDAQAAIATNGAASEHVSTGAIPIAQLTVGKRIILDLPSLSAQAYERYLGILVTSVGTNTAGAITAFLVETPDAWEAFPDATN